MGVSGAQPRMTTRRWMAVVAVVGTASGMERRSDQFRRKGVTEMNAKARLFYARFFSLIGTIFITSQELKFQSPMSRAAWINNMIILIGGILLVLGISLVIQTVEGQQERLCKMGDDSEKNRT
jgi:hypothetical protein